MDKKLFKIPSMEKILKFVCSITIIELMRLNKLENIIDSPNKSCPMLWIKEQMVWLKNRSLSQIKKQEFIQIPKNSNFTLSFKATVLYGAKIERVKINGVYYDVIKDSENDIYHVSLTHES